MLREKLQAITDNGDPPSHENLIEALRAQYPHSIRTLVRKAKYGFNCVVHAFELVDDQDYVMLALACPKDVHANTDFIEFLIERGYLSEQPIAAPGQLAVYFDHGKAKHIGRLLSESIVESKWGIGNLYEHPTFEVPSKYGNDVRYFASISADDAINYFVEFAASKGVKFVRDSDPAT